MTLSSECLLLTKKKLFWKNPFPSPKTAEPAVGTAFAETDVSANAIV